MKQTALICLSFLLFACAPKQQAIFQETELPPDNIDIHTTYAYADADSAIVMIENSYPRGGLKYTAPNGQVYVYGIFWTRISNETDKPVEWSIEFPRDSLHLPAAPDSYFKIVLPAVEISPERLTMFNYGLTDLEAVLDNILYQQPSLHSTIEVKESRSFYVVTLFNIGVNGTVRAGLRIKDDRLYYKVNEVEIPCGQFSIKDLQVPQ